MIRYPITKTQLENLIAAEDATWLQRAKDRTNGFRAKGFYEESNSIWSEIKPVYMRLQGMKCAYCERELESVKKGKVEQDVEHFRPKGNVKAWKAPKKLTDDGIAITAAPATGKGYHLLPYHPLNYAAACKPCNSTLKKDYFPIGGDYALDADDPASLASEDHYLIYPISDIDEDPETVIAFRGLSPHPVADSGHGRHRALVTIEFFKLDDPGARKNLYRDRAILIMALFPLLKETKAGTSAGKAKARATVDSFLKPQLRHLNCARNFRRLFDQDPIEAKAIYDGAVKLMSTIS
jgi:hypothetical protein